MFGRKNIFGQLNISDSPTFSFKNILSNINFFFSTFFKTFQLYWYYNALVLFNRNIYNEMITYIYQQKFCKK